MEVVSCIRLVPKTDRSHALQVHNKTEFGRALTPSVATSHHPLHHGYGRSAHITSLPVRERQGTVIES
jgi:hypothetical protein